MSVPGCLRHKPSGLPGIVDDEGRQGGDQGRNEHRGCNAYAGDGPSIR